jgi:hypothetical protein
MVDLSGVIRANVQILTTMACRQFTVQLNKAALAQTKGDTIALDAIDLARRREKTASQYCDRFSWYRRRDGKTRWPFSFRCIGASNHHGADVGPQLFSVFLVALPNTALLLYRYMIPAPPAELSVTRRH